MLNFFAATQDIAVDGWALTMLTKPNRNLASTMNSIGQTAGYFLGYVVFLALESAEFCNSYWPFRIGLSTFTQNWQKYFCLNLFSIQYKERNHKKQA